MTATVFQSSQMAPRSLTQLLTITGIKKEMPRVIYKKGEKKIVLLELEPDEGQILPKKLSEKNFSSLHDHFGKTVLMAATEKGMDDVVNAAIAALERTPLKRRQKFIMTTINAGHTALDRAKSWECFAAIAKAYNGSTSWPKKSAKRKLTLSDLLGYTSDQTIRSALIDRLFKKSKEFSKKNISSSR